MFYFAWRLIVGVILAGASVHGIANGLGWQTLLGFLPLLLGSVFVFSVLVISPVAATSLQRMREVYFAQGEENKRLRTRALSHLGWVYGALAFLWFLIGMTVSQNVLNGRLLANYTVAGSLVFFVCSSLFFSASAVLKTFHRLRGLSSSRSR